MGRKTRRSHYVTSMNEKELMKMSNAYLNPIIRIVNVHVLYSDENPFRFTVELDLYSISKEFTLEDLTEYINNVSIEDDLMAKTLINLDTYLRTEPDIVVEEKNSNQYLLSAIINGDYE